MDYLMGIDLGSTSLKAMVYDLDGRVASGSRPTERFHPDPQHPEWTVWQPEQIWGGTAAAVREARQLETRQIRAVAVTGMGMDGLPGRRPRLLALPLDQLARPAHRAAVRVVAASRSGRRRSFRSAAIPLWPINSALRILLDGGERAGRSCGGPTSGC